jgi:5-methylcytosine-specific restriction protein A
MPERRLYNNRRWRRLRLQQLASEPHCRMCRVQDGQATIATVADHIEPHRGDDLLFWDPANLQSLCARHHNSDKQSLEKGGRPRVRVQPDG